MSDDVTKPRHYLSHPSGIECIQIAEHMNFCLGNAIKYIWRAGLKTEDPLKDLRKAAWYIAREIQRIEIEQENEKKAFANEERAPAVNEWIPFDGGAMPVDPDQIVQVKCRDGYIYAPQPASNHHWSNENLTECYHIVAYRVLEKNYDNENYPNVTKEGE